MKFHPRWAATALIAVVLGASSVANAALVSRLGGLAYYDTVLDITWLADANYANTTGYDDALYGSNTDGRMTWADANAWAASLTVAGIGGWRLPDTNPVDGVAFDYSYSYDGSTDWGYNISAPGSAYPGSTGSEMAYMYYNNLGNLAYCDTAGTCPQTAWGLTNTGPFSNVQLLSYWSATEYAPYANGAWKFIFGFGEQNFTDKAFGNNAWAVRSGDVGTAVPSVSSVPIPAAVWLFGSGLAGLFGLARRRKK